MNPPLSWLSIFATLPQTPPLVPTSLHSSSEKRLQGPLPYPPPGLPFPATPHATTTSPPPGCFFLFGPEHPLTGPQPPNPPPFFHHHFSWSPDFLIPLRSTAPSAGPNPPPQPRRVTRPLCIRPFGLLALEIERASASFRPLYLDPPDFSPLSLAVSLQVRPLLSHSRFLLAKVCRFFSPFTAIPSGSLLIWQLSGPTILKHDPFFSTKLDSYFTSILIGFTRKSNFRPLLPFLHLQLELFLQTTSLLPFLVFRPARDINPVNFPDTRSVPSIL